MQTVAEVQNTTGRWQEVVATFNQKVDGYERELTELVNEKTTVVLDAELGNVSASKRLKVLDERIFVIRRDAGTTREAVVQAQKKLETAREAESQEAEKARQKEMRELAATALQHAEEFTAGLRQAAKAGAVMKLVIQNLNLQATAQESATLQQLFQPGPYMRAAEFAGLKSHLEFAGYTGPQVHLMSLEDAVAIHLSRWLVKEE